MLVAARPQQGRARSQQPGQSTKSAGAPRRCRPLAAEGMAHLRAHNTPGSMCPARKTAARERPDLSSAEGTAVVRAIGRPPHFTLRVCAGRPLGVGRQLPRRAIAARRGAPAAAVCNALAAAARPALLLQVPPSQPLSTRAASALCAVLPPAPACSLLPAPRAPGPGPAPRAQGHSKISCAENPVGSRAWVVRRDSNCRTLLLPLLLLLLLPHPLPRLQPVLPPLLLPATAPLPAGLLAAPCTPPPPTHTPTHPASQAASSHRSQPGGPRYQVAPQRRADHALLLGQGHCQPQQQGPRPLLLWRPGRQGGVVGGAGVHDAREAPGRACSRRRRRRPSAARPAARLRAMPAVAARRLAACTPPRLARGGAWQCRSRHKPGDACARAPSRPTPCPAAATQLPHTNAGQPVPPAHGGGGGGPPPPPPPPPPTTCPKVNLPQRELPGGGKAVHGPHQGRPHGQLRGQGKAGGGGSSS